MFLNAEPQHDRHERLVQRALADQRLERRDVGLVAFEIGFHHVVVLLDGELDQLLAIFGGLVGQVGRDLVIEELGAEASSFQMMRAVVDEVDQALEVGFGADRQVEHQRASRRGGR